MSNEICNTKDCNKAAKNIAFLPEKGIVKLCSDCYYIHKNS